MESKILRNIIALFAINAVWLFTNALFACGWSENSETVRLALFRAETQGMNVFRPFYYSASYFNSYTPDPEETDQDSNCQEWQNKLGKSVRLTDIALVLYQTPPETFEFAYQNHTLLQTFEGNTFIELLSKPSQKELLSYLVFAKEMEHLNFGMWGKWEDWKSWHSYQENSSDFYAKTAEDELERLPEITDPFLQMRYAFLLLRLRYQQGSYKAAAGLYDTYFAHRKGLSIIQQWALLFKALSIDKLNDHLTANYLYSLVFDRCNEKKLSVMQNFNSRPGMIDSTMALAKNDHERGVILTLSLLHYPGPALDRLKKVQTLIPNSPYMQLLVMREINKLEDWIFTPMFTRYSPSVNVHSNYEWYDDYSKVKEVNYAKDMTYLREFTVFLEECQQTASLSFHNFLNMGLAHLYFMDDRIENGKASLAKVSDKSDLSILIQRDIEVALIELKSGNVNNENTRINLLKSIHHLEKLAQRDFEVYKNLYSLLRIISSEFEKSKEYAEAGLLFMKSERYKDIYENKSMGYEDRNYNNYYWNIGYFDRKASVGDVDHLINIIRNKTKSPIEKYLCNQLLGSLDSYTELKGTLAFRNNDLDLALKTFSELPESFWENNYEFKNYMNEDPYQPKCWEYVYKRTFNYKYSKVKLVKELIALRNSIDRNPQKSADKCLKLAHAYYNCSYWGNAWMMASYGQTSDLTSLGYTDYMFGSSAAMLVKIQDNNYYECTLARSYYQKALETATNDEQRAMASLMIYMCNDNKYSFEFMNMPEGKKPPSIENSPTLFNFYSQWSHTHTFARFHCPLLDDYVGYNLN